MSISPMTEHMMQLEHLIQQAEEEDEHNADAAAGRDALIERLQVDSRTELDTGIRDVMEFHRVFGLGDQMCSRPNIRTSEITGFRVAMLLEELAELSTACRKRDLVGALDALCDLQYFLDGTFIALGMHNVKRKAMTAVHRSNMLKVWPDGTVHRDAWGKVVKPDDWEAPDLKSILKET